MIRIVNTVAMLLIGIGLVACGTSEDKNKQAAFDGEQEPLTLHVLAVHDKPDADIDEYHTELYEGIKHTINQNKDLGIAGDFSLQTYRVFKNYQGPFYIFLGINRLSEPIKNVSFKMTLGDESGNILWQDNTIFLSEEETGILKPNSAVPIIMPLTKEVLKKAEDVNLDNLQMEMTGFYYEEVEN